MKKKEKKAPKFGEKILRLVLPANEAETIAGDYEELYLELLRERNFVYARFWYWTQILKSFYLTLTVLINWSIVMFKNYLKISLRNIKKQKAFSFINISGLAIGMACSILILLWVQNELSYDRFHENADNLYRIVQDGMSVTCAPMAVALKAEMPEVINASRYRPIGNRLIKYKDKSFNNDKFSVVDPDFFEMFSFPLIKGEPEKILNDPFSIVLTEETVKKYFGDENPMGKILNIENKFDFKVTGVLKNLPKNSHIQFDVLGRFEFIHDLWGENLSNWRSSSHMTYVRLNSNADTKDLEKKVNAVVKGHVEDYNQLFLFPLRDIYMSPWPQWIDVEPGSVTYVYVFSLIAFLVLVIACVNFTNLSTARSINRAKEVGVRKVIGAKKGDLIKQFFTESILLSFISFVIALIIVVLLLPVFNNLSGKQLTISHFYDLNIVLLLIGILIFTGILSGSYPSLLVSSFKPVKVLKSAIFSTCKGRSYIRKVLVIFQFSITVLLIISTAVVFKQLNYIHNQELGYDRENIICLKSTDALLTQLSAAGQELLRNPDILSVSISSNLPGRYETTSSKITWDGKDTDEFVRFEVLHADFGFLKTFGLTMVEGSYFSRERISELKDGIIVNESAVKIFGLTNKSALGKQLFNTPIHTRFSSRTTRIIGVVKDFHSRSFHHQIAPLIIRFSPYSNDNLSIRIRAGKLQETLNFLSGIWKRFAPDYSFDYQFFDDFLNDLYKTEQRMGELFIYFAVLAVFVSCLGLLGLTAYIAEQRTREIGIRKALGASLFDIINLISREFLLLVLLSNIIAWPAAYFFMKKWLRNFAYHTNPGFEIFICAGLLALFIALITVSFQAVKAALKDPVDSLHYE